MVSSAYVLSSESWLFGPCCPFDIMMTSVYSCTPVRNLADSEGLPGSTSSSSRPTTTVLSFSSDTGMVQPSATNALEVDDDNHTLFGDDTLTEGETDEEASELNQQLKPHMEKIKAMGLNQPPWPRPLQKSKRAVEREGKFKSKPWSRRLNMVPKSRCAPNMEPRWPQWHAP